MNYAVVMAGGTGKRLWPLSRRKRPKQLLKLIEGQTLLEKCIDRLLPIFDVRNIIVLTNAEYVDIVRDTAPQLMRQNVIAEPCVRDTAGAIGLAATVLNKFDADATMAVVTADQTIDPPEILQTAITDALTYVNAHPDDLVTFGIKPTFPSTQLGYIKCEKGLVMGGCTNKIMPVDSFREKPDYETAKQYLDSENYFWNSGMFVWKAKRLLKLLDEYLPDATKPLQKIKQAFDGPNQMSTLNDWFPKLPKISIDYAVMEKAPNVHAIKLDCKWLDMGSFSSLADIIKSDAANNIVISEKSQLLDCKDSIIITEDKEHLIAAMGLDNIVVAHTPDATLICSRDKTPQLKELLELIEENQDEDYL